MPKNPIGFSVKTFGFTSKVQIKQEVISALQSSPQLRAEIRRVFQMANRRIENIEKALDIISTLMAGEQVNPRDYEEYINNLSPEDQEAADQVNRRTEFQVLTVEYGLY